jgi:hypothetical protein
VFLGHVVLSCCFTFSVVVAAFYKVYFKDNLS